MSTMAGRRNVVWKLPSISGFGLKLFACATLLLYSIGASVIQDGIIHLDQYTREGLSQALSEDAHLMTMAGIGSALQLIGGLSVPIFAFLLTEGFRHTSDRRKYLLTLSLFALLSEVPYDLAMQQSFWDFSSQNALFGTAISLAMLCILDQFREGKGAAAGLIRALITGGAFLWTLLLRVRFGPTTVLLTAIFYLFYARNVLKTILGILVSLVHVTAPLSFYLIWFYNEKQKHKELKYVFYLFYPLHLLVLGIITMLL